MNRLLNKQSLLCGAALFLSATSFGMGSYCSAFRSDGKWAFSYSTRGTIVDCDNVRFALFPGGYYPIERQTQGSYNEYDWNSVWLRCQDSAQVFDGYGTDPMARAVTYAQSANLQFCLFGVTEYP